MSALNTWLRRVAEKYRSAQFADPNGAGATLIGYLAGLVPDALDETCLEAVQMYIPRRGISPPSALPYLLRMFGLPAYEGETYAQAFDRLEDAWLTHARAGTPEGLTIELNRLPGVAGYVYEMAPISPSSTEFWAAMTSPAVSNGLVTYSGQAYGSFIYGRSGISRADDARIRACMLYWRGARVRYRGVIEAP